MSQNSTRLYGLVSTYPSSDLDLAFVVKDEIQASDVERTIRSLVGSELASLELFDVFRGEKLVKKTIVGVFLATPISGANSDSRSVSQYPRAMYRSSRDNS